MDFAWMNSNARSIFFQLISLSFIYSSRDFFLSSSFFSSLSVSLMIFDVNHDLSLLSLKLKYNPKFNQLSIGSTACIFHLQGK